ncbi:MAG: DUF3427 domain-containing protein [Ramlibacter sp.]|uniref:DUF3427 domain-containing protein n=1 Tax=Ramlibacter sp. TaxID=1917967 RepID=UPI002633A5FB|nr:DUF3427 domain-containing protein [Ramlibacter sp.]MDH4377966.1 DUF3427 domain-containing protein [Ramlibacter sp.]
MTHLPKGRYLSLLTPAMVGEIGHLLAEGRAETAPLHPAEAADRLALHLTRVLEKGISSMKEDERVGLGIKLTSELVKRIAESTLASLADGEPDNSAKILTALLGTGPDGMPEAIPEPLIPLLDTALMTNAPGDPRVGQQVLTEIGSADRIDLIMAFIRLSGIQPLLGALRRHCEAGRPLRVLTTTYTGSTQSSALSRLQELGAQVRVSYDEGMTRLHAKAWLFQRNSGFSTAYVGSSNLTHSAQVTGLEWNVRFSEARNPHVLDKVAAVFDSYWHSGDFIEFDPGQFQAAIQAGRRGSPALMMSPVELRPEPFQERLLEQIELSRQQGHHRNLLVSATGTGKTVMAALDYAGLRQRLPRARLLFVAHRKEILEQTLATFRHALRDASFGELWVDGQRPQAFDHVFASIQSLSRSRISKLDAAHFDIVVIDEFHHAEAATYRALISHLQPTELLGLTATPERADGLPLLHWFGGRIAAELRLWDAIDQHRLVPFTYYGLADSLDYREIPWRRGRGYEVSELSKIMTADDAWARKVAQALSEKVDDIGSIRALGFCVSVDHARFMARVFQSLGIRSVAIWGDTPADLRQQALRQLAAGAINVLFSVDLFNEGVDVPSVDTLLMLRPTDSATLFLQQFGRGLRRHPGKSTCIVIDFIGHHRREFRLDNRLRALVGGNRASLKEQVEAGFPFLPAGCHLEFDRVAQDRVLESIKSSLPQRWDQKVGQLREMCQGGRPVGLVEFLEETGLELEDLYSGNKCWTDLLTDAGLAPPASGEFEAGLRRAISRVLHVDDTLRLDGYLQLARRTTAPAVDELSVREQRLLRMLVTALMSQVTTPQTSFKEAVQSLWQQPLVLQELRELMEALQSRVSHLGKALIERPEVPLTVHARYSRVEIQSAFGDGDKARAPVWREGVKWMQGENCDVFLVTFDKTGKRFSPTTRYRDYAISRNLLHWESQSRTKASDPTGTRYRLHQDRGSGVMIFARLNEDDRSFFFLGAATYVSHQSDMPMQVTWQLRHPLPGDLYATFAAAVA